MAIHENCRCKNILHYFSIPKRGYTNSADSPNFSTHLKTLELKKWKIRDKLSNCLGIDGEECVVGIAALTDAGDFLYSEEVTIVSNHKYVHFYGHGNLDVFRSVCAFFVR